MKNVAYIDGSNLDNGIKKLDWDFDYARFRIWLKDKYKIEEAYIFLGKIEKLKDLYKYLVRAPTTSTGAKIVYINDQKSILQKEKAPSEDETSQGSYS